MEKPTLSQRFEGLSTFVWNSKEGKVLGRGGRSWAEISAFYIVYYACLASFFAATLAVFYETLDDDRPKLLEDSSLLNGNPGMGFRPRVDLNDPKVKAKPVAGKNKDYVKNLKEFLDNYEQNLQSTSCDHVKTTRTGKGDTVPCEVDFAELTKDCNHNNEYGFKDGKPCVLIKLNKVFGWEPKLWADANDNGVPDSIKSVYDNTVVPLRCYAKDKSDQKEIGTVVYHPQQGFPIRYYPYMKQKDYRAPVVFAQFANVTRGSTYEIECRAYAKNIEYDRTELQGSTQFKLYVSN